MLLFLSAWIYTKPNLLLVSSEAPMSWGGIHTTRPLSQSSASNKPPKATASASPSQIYPSHEPDS
jgi:hypothetical protein